MDTHMLELLEFDKVRELLAGYGACALGKELARQMEPGTDADRIQAEIGLVTEMVGALAPRHVLIIAPTRDTNFRADSVDRIALAARPVFKLHGHGSRLRVEHPDCGHDFPPAMREAAYKLIDTALKDSADPIKAGRRGARLPDTSILAIDLGGSRR